MKKYRFYLNLLNAHRLSMPGLFGVPLPFQSELRNEIMQGSGCLDCGAPVGWMR
jgi:hypothetical protein